MKVRLSIIAITGAAIPLSFIRAPYPDELSLQHVPTVIGLALLLAAVKTGSLGRVSFTCVVGFLWLHIIGARWIYTFVPYDDFAARLTGRSLSDRFGWERNHYDRLVHAASGVLGVPPASELLQRFGGMKPLGAAVMAVSCVLSIGAIYEIFEWQIAMTFSPTQAEAYNGQQGDVWDPQKDLALAGIGAIISASLFHRWSPFHSEGSKN